MGSEDHGTLFVVALPIGCKEDLTARALRIIQKVNFIACEDTRVFRNNYGDLLKSNSRLISYYDQNEEKTSDELIQILKKGSDVALVSDAGTPFISDPGFRILKKCFDFDISVLPVPGASALTAALSIAPLGGTTHSFLGFLSKKSKERIETLRSQKSRVDKTVIYESANRIEDLLTDIKQAFDEVPIFIGRELTKTHEEHFFGMVSEGLDFLKEKKPKGEFVIVVAVPKVTRLSKDETSHWVKREIQSGKSGKSILNQIKDQTSLSRKELFELIEEIKSQS